METREQDGGRKEVVTDYEERLGGTVVPTAYNDRYGGRPGLDHETRLPPPIDDPEFDENGDLVATTFPVQQTAAPAAQPAHTPAAASDVRPDALMLPPLELGSSVPHYKTKNPPGDLFENTAPQEASVSQNTARHAPPQTHDSPSIVAVVLEGEFGRFRTKVSDVQICENHVALVYTGEAGDSDLTFEPPLGSKFTVVVPMKDGNFQRIVVAHYGLITRLDVGCPGTVVVVLPKGSEDTPEDSEQ